MAGFLIFMAMFAFPIICIVFAKPIIAILSILTGDKNGLYDSNLCEEKYYKSLFSKYYEDHPPVRHNSYNWKNLDDDKYWRNRGEENMN